MKACGFPVCCLEKMQAEVGCKRAEWGKKRKEIRKKRHKDLSLSNEDARASFALPVEESAASQRCPKGSEILISGARSQGLRSV